MKWIAFIICFTINAFCSAQLSFIDRTADLGFESYHPAFEYGCGVAAADYDNDGFIDLYVLSDANSANRLYRNNGDGTLSVVEVGLSEMMKSRAALWFDYNGDHLLDLVVAGDCFAGLGSCKDVDNIRLFEQTSDGQFENVTSESGILTDRDFDGAFGGFTAGDINNDGYLDLLTVMWEGNMTLFINNGDGTFSDITESAGLNIPGRYWQPTFFDFDQDGFTDLYLNVDSFENLFFRNNGDNTFSEIGEQLNLNLDWDCMGLALGDYDNDGDMDLYISNIYSNTEHNAMLQNNGVPSSLQFTEVGRDIGVGEGGWGWGVTFLDGNNDGYLDLAATNGWHANQGVDRSKFWLNNGDGTFNDASVAVSFNGNLEATTLISIDLERDGDMDLIQTIKEDQGGGIRYYENQLNPAETNENYIVIKPRMSGANRFAIGSVVKLRTGTRIQSRPITAGISYYGQEPAEAFFGVGDSEVVDEIAITWPGGSESTFHNLSINHVVMLTDESTLHAPAALQIRENPGPSVELSWGHMSSNETEYIVERSGSVTFDQVISFNISSESKMFIDNNVQPYSSYYYRIRAKNNFQTTAPSQSVCLTTGSGIYIESPANLLAEAKSLTDVVLFWDDLSDNENGFKIERSLSDSFNSIVTFDLPQDKSQFEDGNLEPHTTYFYRIRAIGEGAVSNFSNITSVTTTILKTIENYKITIYPNPASESIHVQILEYSGQIDFELEDILGRSIPISNSTYQDKITIIPDRNIPSGIYFLTLTSPAEKSIHRVLVK